MSAEAPAASPVYEWKITVAHDLFGIGRLVPQMLGAALARSGVSMLWLFALLGLIVVSVPVWVGLVLGAVTATIFGIFDGLSQLLGTPAAFGLALVVILASLLGGLFVLGRLLLRALRQAVDRERIHWTRVPRLVGRLRFWTAILALVPLGPLAYALVSLAELSPGSFTGDTTGSGAWHRFFFDQVLNGALLGLPQAVGRISNIEPVVWYAKVLMLLYKLCLLNGFFWTVFGAFKLVTRADDHRFTGTKAELAEHLRVVLNDMPQIYRLQFPVDLVSATAPIVIDDGRRDVRDLRVELECLGVVALPGDLVAFYTELHRELRTTLGTQ